MNSARMFEKNFNSAQKAFELIQNYLYNQEIEKIPIKNIHKNLGNQSNIEGEEQGEGGGEFEGEEQEEEYVIKNPKSAMRWFEKVNQLIEKMKKHSNQSYYFTAKDFFDMFEKNKDLFEKKIKQ